MNFLVALAGLSSLVPGWTSHLDAPPLLRSTEAEQAIGMLTTKIAKSAVRVSELPAVATQQRQLPKRLLPGVALLRQQNYAEARRVFEALVRTDPEDGLAWYHLGVVQHALGELDQALRAHLLATHLVTQGHPLRVNATYNMACAYALQGKTERALQWLHRARNAGFQNFRLLASDTDLNSLREDPRFAAVQSSGSLPKPTEDSATVVTVTKIMPGGTGGVEVGPDGTLYVATFGADVWRIAPDGTWEVLASGFTKSADCTLDAHGNLLQVDHAQHKVWSIAPDGTRTDLEVEGLNAPVGIDTASDGSLYVTNYNSDAILHVAPDGSSRQIVSGGLLNGPNGIADAGEQGVFIANYKDGVVTHLDPASGELRFVAELPGGGNGHLAWTGEALLATDRAGNCVYRVTPAGGVTLVAGTGTRGTVDGGAVSCVLSLPNGIALSADGRTLYVNERLPGDRSIVRRIELAAERE